MADYGDQYTDKQTEKLQKDIEEVYGQAYKEINVKLDQFQEKFSNKNEKYWKMVDSGEMSDDEYSKWLDGQIFQQEQWESKKDQIIKVMSNANQEATKIINGGLIDTFAENANWTSYTMEHGKGINFGFGLYDKTAVTQLIKDNSDVLPKWKIDEKKDYIWNKKKVNRVVTQGIIQGKKLDEITKDLSNKLVAQNQNLMKTFARTAMTGAQNSGRNQSLKDAKDLGINVYKEWMATLDARTRDSHAAMDGERQKVGDKWHPFKFSNGCRFPGDPLGPPHEVYNCRCTLVGDIEDYPAEYERRDNIDGVPIKNMTYKEWKEAKKQNINPPKINSLGNVKNNQDILDVANDIIKSIGIDYSDIEITMNPTLNHGECRIDILSPDIVNTCKYTGYNLNPNDTRPIEYRVKTAYHEAFHLSLNGKSWDAINSNVSLNDNWVNIEETLTECAAHYKMKEEHGVDNLLPSYPYKLVWNLPRLKQLDEFSECNSIQDFGEIAWNDRVTNYNDKSGNWRNTSKNMKKHKIGTEYYRQYSEYIDEHKDVLLDKLIEGGVLPSNLKHDALDDLDRALNLVNHAHLMPGYDSGDGIVYYNVMAQAMQEVGVK